MTSHGFGKPTIRSGKIIPGQITAIAKEISRQKPVKLSHVVKHIICGETVGYDIIFEFEHLANYKMKPNHLLNKLKTIRVGKHQIAKSTDFWIIQESYKNGKLLPHSHP